MILIQKKFHDFPNITLTGSESAIVVKRHLLYIHRGHSTITQTDFDPISGLQSSAVSNQEQIIMASARYRR